MAKAELVETISVMDFIKSLPFFEEFSDEEKDLLVHKKGIFEKYTNGETIISEGNTESWLFVLLLGKVSLSKLYSSNVKKGHISLKKAVDVPLKELEIGSIFGEISLITNRPRNVTVRATSPEVAVMKVTKEILDSFDDSIQMKFHKQLLLKLAENLDDMNTELSRIKSDIIPIQ